MGVTGRGEVVAAELLPAGLFVPPGPEDVANCGVHFGPVQLDGAGRGLGSQFRRVEGRGRGGGDSRRPVALIAIGVDGPNLVVVGSAGDEIGMGVGGAGEVVAADL